MRIAFGILLLFSIAFMPFYLSFILVLGGMIYFHFFIEGICILLLSDLLYGVKEAKFFNIIFISLLISIILFVIIEILKKKLKFYPKQ